MRAGILMSCARPTCFLLFLSLLLPSLVTTAAEAPAAWQLLSPCVRVRVVGVCVSCHFP